MLNPLQLEPSALWRERFRAPLILWTQQAKAAPTRGLVASTLSGKNQLHAWDIPTGELRQLTDRATGVPLGTLAPDGRWVYYLQDKDGNEIGHFVRVPYTGGATEDLTPDLPPYSSFLLHTSQTGDRIGFVFADSTGFHCCCVDRAAADQIGPARVLYHSPKTTHGPTFSYDGELAVLVTTERSTHKHTNLLALDAATGERVAELWDGQESSLEAVAFAPLSGDLRLLAMTNRSGVSRPIIWHPRSGARQDLLLAELAGDVVPLDWSPDGKQILLCQVHQAIQQLYRYHLTDQTLTRLVHPAGTFSLFPGRGVYFADTGAIIAHWQDATHPPQIMALDSRTGAQQRTLLAAAATPPGLGWRSVTFPSSDGQLIQGWLATPAGAGPFPTILHTHGGPEFAMTELFAPATQSWLDHGFAWLTVNYRGSTTFGRAFQEQIWGNLGHWEVEDMAAAHRWLVQSGVAEPTQILLTGWSYGGYLTLLALGKRPELWAGGMAGIAIADWTASYEDSADSLRGYQVALFGGTPQEKPTEYAAGSPITYAEAVRAPVLIIQGRNDTRTPARPVALYEAKLQALGKPIEVHWFEAGHTGAGIEQAIAHQELMLRFAYRTLGLAT